MEVIFSAIVGVFGVSTQINEFVVTPLRSQFRYLFRHDDFIQELRVEVERLDNEIASLQGRIDAASSNLEVIRGNVVTWIRRAATKKAEADAILATAAEVQNGTCLSGTCSNLKSRCSSGKQAKKITEVVRRLRVEWRKFKEVSDISRGIDSVYQSLKLSYDALEREDARYFFHLCCLFPEDSNILIEDLVYYGVALGIFYATTNIREARDRAHSLVEMLKDHFLLMDADASDYRGTCVKMHDVIRDMALSIAFKRNDGVNEVPLVKNAFMVRHDRGLKVWPVNDCPCEDITCISLALEKETFVPKIINYPRLEALSLKLEGGFQARTLPKSFFDGVTCLRFLSISDAVSSLSLDKLKELRVLHLPSYKSGAIPFLGDLVNLEILSLYASSIEVLPKEIGALTNLKVLNLNDSESLKNIAPGVVSSLSQLEELRLRRCPIKWEVEEKGSERSNASLAEVFSLRNLNLLEIWIGGLELIPQDTGHLNNLTSYHIRIGKLYPRVMSEEFHDDKCMIVQVDEINVGVRAMSALFVGAERLYLSGSGTQDIIDLLARQGFQNLKELDLQNSDTTKHLATTTELQDLISRPTGDVFPVLRRLSIGFMKELEEICHGPPTVRSFSELQELELYHLTSLTHLWKDPCGEGGVATFHHVSFQNLRSLILKGLPKLSTLCEAIDVFEFPSIENLEIEGCPNLKFSGQPLPFLSNKQHGSSFPIRLHKLRIGSSQRLRTLFSHDTLRGLVNLRELEVFDCSILEEIVELEQNEEQRGTVMIDKTIIPRLETLKLSDLPMIRYFGTFNNGLELPSLEKVIIENCPMMKAFALESFDNSVANSIPSFFFSKKVICFNLRELVLKAHNFISPILCHEIPTASLIALRRLKVESCHSLKSLFSPEIFRELTNLEELEIKDCSMLEEVIPEEEETIQVGGGLQESEVVWKLPKLKNLVLCELPKMVRFSYLQSDLELPLLERIEIHQCTELKSSLSLGLRCLPNWVKLFGISDPKLASRFFFDKELTEDEGRLKHGCFKLFQRDFKFIPSPHREGIFLVRGLSNEFFFDGWGKAYAEFEIKKLTPKLTYEMIFVIMLTREPVYNKFKFMIEMTSDDHEEDKMYEHEEDAEDKPTMEWIEILGGEFTPSSGQYGQLLFSVTKNNSWEDDGILLEGVYIRLKAESGCIEEITVDTT